MASQHEEEVLGKAYDSRLIAADHDLPAPLHLAGGDRAGGYRLKAGADVLGPYLTKVAVDRYLVKAAGTHSFFDSILSNKPLTGIGEIAAIYVLLLGLSFLFDFLQTYFMQWTGQMAMFDLRKELFRHLQRMHIGFYDKNPVGRLVTRITSDVDALNEMFTSGVVSIFEDIFVLAGIVGIMLHMDWRLALITFAVLPFHRNRHHDLPRQCTRLLSPDSRSHRPHQCIPAGARQRHGGTAAFQPRASAPSKSFPK